MRAIFAIVIAVLVGAAVVLVVLFRWDDTTRPSRPVATPTVLPEDDLVPRERVRARPPSVPAPHDDTGSAPTVHGAPEAIPEDASPGTLLVLDDHTDTPCPGIVVHFLEVGEGEGMPDVEMGDWGFDLRNICLPGARHLTTDAAGRVRLPAFEDAAVVYAVAAGLAGAENLRAEDSSEWELELMRIDLVRVHVVDSSGVGLAGVPVTLLAFEQDGKVDRDVDEKTDETGRAGLMYFRERDHVRLRVAAAVPVAEPPTADMEPDAIPAGFIRLELPPTGSVGVVVVDEEGARLGEGVSVRLRTMSLEDDETWRGRLGRTSTRTSDATGEVVFPAIGVGLQLRATVSGPSQVRLRSTAELEGPRSPGERLDATITAGPLCPVVTGRLVARDGSPVAGLPLYARLKYSGTTDHFGYSRTHAETDDAGRFRIVFHEEPRIVENLWLRLERRVGAGEKSHTYREVVGVDLPDEIVSGETDVGDVVVYGLGRLVSGRVVDADGEPLSGASVRLMTSAGWGHRSQVDDIEPDTTTSEGGFELRGGVADVDVHLGVRLGTYFLDTSPTVLPGSTDVALTLQSGGGVEGSVVLPSETIGSDVYVVVRGEPQRVCDTDPRRPGEGIVEAVRNGAFSIQGLRPGVATVEFRSGRATADALLVVENVEVVAGRVTHDPRLQHVDLSARLHAADITPVTDDGHTLPGARVYARLAGSRSWQRVKRDGRGVAPVRTSDPIAQVLVACGGHRTAVIDAPTGAVSVELTPITETVVTLALADAVRLPPDPFQLRAHLHWLGPPGDEPSDDVRVRWNPRDPVTTHDDTTFGSGGTVRIAVSEPGVYGVHLLFWRTTEKPSQQVTLATSPGRVFVRVPGDGKPVRVQVTPDAGDLASELAGDD